MQRRAPHPWSSALFGGQQPRPSRRTLGPVQRGEGANQLPPIGASPKRGLGKNETSVQQRPLTNGHGADRRLFRSFFGAGFECSTHVLHSGRRLDLIAATEHDKFAHLDYQRLSQEGLKLAREGVRWHLVERQPGRYDFSSVFPITQAARATGTQVAWDLCHFGWPDHLDLFSADFVEHLARYGAAFTQWLVQQTDEPPLIVPVNEISFFSWAAGDAGGMYPFAIGRGFELKKHLVRASIETMKSIWAAVPQARFIQVDPVIHVVAHPRHPEEIPEAEAYRLSQYQAWDMLRGRLCPELGGQERFLDIVGVNYYPHNQWVYNLKNFRQIRKFTPLTRSDARYRPFREILVEVYQRYRRPLMISETGAEDRRRSGWLRYVCEESRQAIKAGVPLEAICLYPILNHPGWADDRHCHNALWDYPDAKGHREIYRPLARELKRWRGVFGAKPLLGNLDQEGRSALTNSRS